MAMMLRSSASACRRLRSLSTASLFSSPFSSSSTTPYNHGSSSFFRRAFPVFPAARVAADRVPVSDCRPHFTLGISRSFSSDITQLPAITDPDIEVAFKDLMASSWDEIPEGVVYYVEKALSKATEDKAAQEALANLFRAAEASVEFGAVLVSLRMALDDSNGLFGENVKPVSEELLDALAVAYKRYMAYLDAFSLDENYLRKKVEMELGTKMLHLKMRCSSLGSEWGKVSLLGTSGLSGSYVEHRGQ